MKRKRLSTSRGHTQTRTEVDELIQQLLIIQNHCLVSDSPMLVEVSTALRTAKRMRQRAWTTKRVDWPAQILLIKAVIEVVVELHSLLSFFNNWATNATRYHYQTVSTVRRYFAA